MYRVTLYTSVPGETAWSLFEDRASALRYVHRFRRTWKTARLTLEVV